MSHNNFSFSSVEHNYEIAVNFLQSSKFLQTLLEFTLEKSQVNIVCLQKCFSNSKWPLYVMKQVNNTLHSSTHGQIS